MSDGRERMGKRSPERWRRLRKWTSEKAKTASFWLVSLALLVLLLSLWVMFDDMIKYDAGWIYDSLGVTEKAAALKTLGLAIAGVVAFWGVVVANRRAKAMADSAKATADSAKAAADSAKAANSTANATEAGNRQRAFKDGVEHLGSDKSSVRQGGAHALFHLALEDEKLSASIAGVLCAYIRETTGDKGYQEEKNKDKPSTEMQSLLRLLFTTETVDKGRLERFWGGITPDLNGGYFCGVELEGAQFQGAKLRSAQFQGASLGDAQFQGAVLGRAQFQGAALEGAQFQGAWLRRAQFQGARLGRAQFQEARLRKSQFQGAALEGAQFQGAALNGAQFQEARLRRAQFQEARLGRAQFQGAALNGAQFQGASLEGVQFQGAALHGAEFQGVPLNGAQFQGAALEGAQFQGASLEQAQFQGALLGGARFQGALLERAQFQGADLGRAQFQGARLSGSQFQGAWLYMAGFQQAKFGQGPEHEGIPAQDHTTAKPDELVEQLKASAFHGASSERHVRESLHGASSERHVREWFDEGINDRTDQESNFSGVIFSGGVTKKLLAEVKEALEPESWFLDDPDFNEELMQNLESEIGQPESHTSPKEVIAGSYGQKDAERWIREFRKVMATASETNQAA